MDFRWVTRKRLGLYLYVAVDLTIIVSLVAVEGYWGRGFPRGPQVMWNLNYGQIRPRLGVLALVGCAGICPPEDETSATLHSRQLKRLQSTKLPSRRLEVT